MPLPSVAAVYAQVDQARRAGPLVTNFYPVPDKLQRSVDRGELFSVSAGGVLFVLRRDRDFLHVSYVASKTADLAAALAEVAARVPGTLTVDVIAPGERIAELAAPVRAAGFADLLTLTRMTKLGEAAALAADDAEVVLADQADGAALAGMLETALDRHAEQIPDADEMARAAAERKVLIVRADAAIAGLLFYEKTGQASLLRHWLVDPAYRDRRVGARLMRRYFADCAEVRRFVLWVISDNHNAIDRYRHYGYAQDGLIDQVLIRRAS